MIVTHLEAFGRLMAGIAPWLDLEDRSADERAVRARYRALTARALAHALDPASPDALNFTQGGQPLVDAAFLAQAVLRAPRVLQHGLEPATRTRLVAAFESARVIQPGFNNWLLFAATVEAALKALGADWDRMRVDYALRQHEQWYRGDGAYSDGPAFHWDYYNSFVIHPMLVDVLAAVGDAHPAWTALRGKQEARATRYAARPRTAGRARRHVSRRGPVDCLPVWRVPGPGAGRAASHPSGRGRSRPGTRGADRRDRPRSRRAEDV